MSLLQPFGSFDLRVYRIIGLSQTPLGDEIIILRVVKRSLRDLLDSFVLGPVLTRLTHYDPFRALRLARACFLWVAV